MKIIFTLQKEYLDPRFFSRIPGETRIGSVIEIKIVLIVGFHGIEVSVPSTRDHFQTSCVLMTRGKTDL